MLLAPPNSRDRSLGFTYQICNRQRVEKDFVEKVTTDARIMLMEMELGYLLVEMRPWRVIRLS